MTPHHPSFALLFALLLSACSNDQVAGGVDANTNYLQGQLVLPTNKHPVDSLPVYLEAPQNTNLAKTSAIWNRIDSTVTDSLGKYAFHIKVDGSYRVSSFVGDSLVFESIVDFDASQGANIGSGTLSVIDTNGILIDDFETPDATNALIAWFSDAADWNFSEIDSARVSLTPKGVDSNFALGIEDCGAQGKCFHMTSTTLIDEALYEFIPARNLLRSYHNACVKTSYVDSMQMKAMGSGKLSMGYWLLDSLLDWNNAEFNTLEFDLTENWETYTIPVAPNRNICLHKIEFGLVGTGELWADDIHLLGTTIVDLIH